MRCVIDWFLESNTVVYFVISVFDQSSYITSYKLFLLWILWNSGTPEVLKLILQIIFRDTPIYYNIYHFGFAVFKYIFWELLNTVQTLQLYCCIPRIWRIYCQVQSHKKTKYKKAIQFTKKTKWTNTDHVILLLLVINKDFKIVNLCHVLTVRQLVPKERKLAMWQIRSLLDRKSVV